MALGRRERSERDGTVSLQMRCKLGTGQFFYYPALTYFA
jgi:hypothetical protein